MPRELDTGYYEEVTVQAQHAVERLLLLEMGCTYTDIRTMPYEDALVLLAAHTGRKQAEAERMGDAHKDAERTRAGSNLPGQAYHDAAFWDFGDTSNWGKPITPVGDGPQPMAWTARDTEGTRVLPVETWMGMPPE